MVVERKERKKEKTKKKHKNLNIFQRVPCLVHLHIYFDRYKWIDYVKLCNILYRVLCFLIAFLEQINPLCWESWQMMLYIWSKYHSMKNLSGYKK
jgi:hypothetical protein